MARKRISKEEIELRKKVTKVISDNKKRLDIYNKKELLYRLEGDDNKAEFYSGRQAQINDINFHLYDVINSNQRTVTRKFKPQNA